MGKYEVTFNQYDVFRVIKGKPKPPEAGWGREDRPVINVSWHEAKAYAEWLKEKTGKNYDLPSGQQWEYAARGHQDLQKPPTVYPWGDEIGQNKANCDGCGSVWDSKSTAPVGSFQPNGFGLYDTSGNVAEWVLDCDDLDEDKTTCALRVVRGGSWFLEPVGLRSANRYRSNPGYRNNNLGFRLAQY
jgi:formylglycine-generating enzyme required for sulfatase activity